MDEQEQQKNRRFSPDEVGELVELAGRLDEYSRDISLDNLKEVAAEMGVSEAALHQAIEAKDELAAKTNKPKKKAKADKEVFKGTPKQEKILNLRRSLPGLITGAVSVAAVDFMTTGAITWSRWALFGIGMAVLALVVPLINPNDE